MLMQTLFSPLKIFYRGIQGCHMKADVLPSLKMWCFLCYNLLNGSYCCPKLGQISRFFLHSGVPEGPRGGIKVGVQQESCSDHYSEQLSR